MFDFRRQSHLCRLASWFGNFELVEVGMSEMSSASAWATFRILSSWLARATGADLKVHATENVAVRCISN